MKKQIMFEMWEIGEEESVIRFVTHPKLTIDDINATIDIVKTNNY